MTYTPTPFVDQWSTWPATDSGSFSSAFLATITAGTDHLTTVVQVEATAQRLANASEEQANQAYLSLTPEQRTQWDDAFKNCPEPTDYAEAFHPKDYYSLIGEYRAMLGTVDAAVNSEFGDQYRSCMTSAGYAVTSYEDVLQQLVGTEPSAGDIPPVGSDGGPSWNRWFANVRGEMAADAECRKDAFAAGWALLAPKIDQFRQDHAAELAAEAAGWQEVVTGSGQSRAPA